MYTELWGLQLCEVFTESGQNTAPYKVQCLEGKFDSMGVQSKAFLSLFLISEHCFLKRMA